MSGLRDGGHNNPPGKRRFEIVALAAILLCAAQPTIADPTFVHPSDINLHPDRYIGHKVSIEGFVVLGDEHKAMEGFVIIESKAIAEKEDRLYASAESFDAKPYLKYCLDIANPERFIRQRAKYDRKTSILTGTIVNDHNVLGGCSGPLAIQLD